MEAKNNQQWQNTVKNDVAALNAKYNLSKINSNFFATKYKIIFFMTAILGVVLFIIGFIFSDTFEANMKTEVFYILGSLILVASLIFFGVIQGKMAKVRRKILSELNLTSYYSSAIAQITDNQYNLASLKKQFDLQPHNFLPGTGTNRTDNVLNITGKATKFSFGTITNEVVSRTTDAKGNTHTTRTYTRYCYLNVLLLAESQLVATIKKSGSFLKVFKSKDNTDLESTEFEKIFAVVANDQILIRKLLVPKVLANLVDKANSEKEIPAIEFKNQNLTICWPSFKVSSWSDPKGAIAEPKLFDKKANLADTLCEKIIEDINQFLACLSWVDTYDLW